MTREQVKNGSEMTEAYNKTSPTTTNVRAAAKQAQLCYADIDHVIKAKPNSPSSTAISPVRSIKNLLNKIISPDGSKKTNRKEYPDSIVCIDKRVKEIARLGAPLYSPTSKEAKILKTLSETDLSLQCKRKRNPSIKDFFQKGKKKPRNESPSSPVLVLDPESHEPTFESADDQRMHQAPDLISDEPASPEIICIPESPVYQQASPEIILEEDLSSSQASQEVPSEPRVVSGNPKQLSGLEKLARFRLNRSITPNNPIARKKLFD